MKHGKSPAARLAAAALTLLTAACLLTAAFSARAAGVAVTVVSLNSAPVAENIECTTYRGVSVSGSFKAVDPEGDELTFSVSADPKKGSVAVDGGSFVYTPADGSRGKDSFTYVAVDSVGNSSEKATVTVAIKKQSTKVTYSDLRGSGIQYAATALAEKGVFSGEKVGDAWLFRPAEAVSRGEFLAMCMELCGARLREGVTRTGFYDDGEIPAWEKPYVATALMDKLISGTTNGEGRAVFAASDPVTFAEATVMLDNALEITDVSVPDDGGACPAWASQAVTNLSSCGVVTAGSGGVSAPMTRADAAGMLLGAVSVLEARGGAKTLSWNK